MRRWWDEYPPEDAPYPVRYGLAPRPTARDVHHRSGGLLDPGVDRHHHMSGIHRSHSTGSRGNPRGVPEIHINNINDHNVHAHLHARVVPPLAPPPPHQRIPNSSTRNRAAAAIDDDDWALAEETAAQSRSRGRPGFGEHHFHHHDHFGPAAVPAPAAPAPGYRTSLQMAVEDELLNRKWRQDMEQRLAQQNRDAETRLLEGEIELNNIKKQRDRDKETERIQELLRHQRMEDDRKRKQDADRIDALKKQALRDDKDRATEEAAKKKKAVEEHQLEMAEQGRKAKENEDRIISQFMQNKAEEEQRQKEEEERIVQRVKKREEEQREKERREWQAFEHKQKEQREKAEAEKKQKEEEFEADMRKRLAEFGLQDDQIKAMIKPEKPKDQAVGIIPGMPQEEDHRHHPRPTYIKVHRDHLDLETLAYYKLPWEFDRTDGDYIIILREMDQRETEVLFEHTRRIRNKTADTRYLIQERRDRGGKPQYAWVRKRSKSTSPIPIGRTSRPKKVGWLV